jgi:predicted nucleic acid-binding protein
MAIKFFVDTCIFIEAFKKTGLKEAKELYTAIFKDFVNEFFINEVVIDEVLFYYINNKGKFYFTTLEELVEIFDFFEFLVFDKDLLDLWIKMIKIHKLKTHDALILATCKHHGIKYLISIDREDFTIPCEKEGIVLIDSIGKLKEVLNLNK